MRTQLLRGTHVGATALHDAIEAEVQIGLVELKQLLKQGFQLFEFLAHDFSLFFFSDFGFFAVTTGALRSGDALPGRG